MPIKITRNANVEPGIDFKNLTPGLWIAATQHNQEQTTSLLMVLADGTKYYVAAGASLPVLADASWTYRKFTLFSGSITISS